MLLICLVTCRAARADDNDAPRGTTAATVTLDLRARLGDGEPASSKIYSSYFDLRSDALLGRGRYVNLRGIREYGRFRYEEANLEWELRAGRSAVSDGTPVRLQAGIIRVPFGIYDSRETYASGLIAYPLPRSDYAYDAVDWSVPGADVVATRGNFQAEASAFSGLAGGTWANYNRMQGQTLRLQMYAPPNLILGVSGWTGNQAPYPQVTERERTAAGGVDWRFTQSHLVLRGELIAGTLAGDRMHGGYFDVYYRLPGIETVTLVGRVEGLKPATDQPASRQATVGARWSLGPEWTLSGNYVRNNLARAYGFTWTDPTRAGGAVVFQLLRRF
jgi:hypothetical protein